MDGAVEKGCDDNTSIGLVRAILQRAPGAEDDLFRRYQGAVSSIACMAGAGQWTADDVLQETFRIAIEKIRNGEVRDPERLPGFICAVARNQALAARRRNAQTPLEVTAEPSGGPHQLDAMIDRETAAVVRRLLRELTPERDREILFRFYLDEQEKDRICADLNLTSLQFNRVLYRARERFRELWDRRMKA